MAGVSAIPRQSYEREEGEHPADDVASNTLALDKDLTASVAVPEKAGNLASST